MAKWIGSPLTRTIYLHTAKMVNESFEARYIHGAPDECWLWIGPKTTTKYIQYGRFYFKGKLVSAHRFSYQQFVGPIPEGMHLDHLCRVPLCVNPAHLEPVTNLENIRRSTEYREKKRIEYLNSKGLTQE